MTIYMNRILFLFILLTACPAFAAQQSGGNKSEDPYAQTDYAKAFDQDKIWGQHPEVLRREGLGHLLRSDVYEGDIWKRYIKRHPKQSIWKGISNLLGVCREMPCCACGRGRGYAPVPLIIQPPSLQEETRFSDDSAPFLEAERESSAAFSMETQTQLPDDAVIERLLREKEADAYRQVKDEVCYGCCQACCLGSLIPLSTVVPALSMGAGFGGFVVMQQSTQLVYTAWTQHRKILRVSGADPLLSYELIYAVEKRRIPSILWSGIEKKLTEARNNSFARAKILEYLTTVFNLPQGKKTLLKLDGMTPETFDQQLLEKSGIAYEKMQRLYRKIEGFFENYEEGPDRSNTIKVIKTAVRKHVRHSLDPYAVDKNDRYGKFVFLQGPGGLGKTEFVNTLAQWLYLEEGNSDPKMEDFIPLTLVSAGPEKLLGTAETPGALLTGLTKQSSGRAPINRFLLVDEAEAINDPALKASFKALFEPANGIFSSPYLGGLEVPIAENLIFFISNDEIVDAAFRQRVAPAVFPKFKQSFLRKKLYLRLAGKVASVLTGLESQEHAEGELDFQVFKKYLQVDGLQGIEELLKREDVVIRDIEKEVEGFLDI